MAQHRESCPGALGPPIHGHNVMNLTTEPLYRRLDQLELAQPHFYLLQPKLPEALPPLLAERSVNLDSSPLQEPPDSAT